LDNGDSVQLSYVITATDSNSATDTQTVVVTITGTDDTSIITGAATGSVNEGNAGDVATATGTLAISDVDTDDSPAFTANTYNGTFGNIALAANGAWTYS
jgi:hypothetical protein